MIEEYRILKTFIDHDKHHGERTFHEGFVYGLGDGAHQIADRLAAVCLGSGLAVRHHENKSKENKNGN